MLLRRVPSQTHGCCAVPAVQVGSHACDLSAVLLQLQGKADLRHRVAVYVMLYLHISLALLLSWQCTSDMGGLAFLSGLGGHMWGVCLIACCTKHQHICTKACVAVTGLNPTWLARPPAPYLAVQHRVARQFGIEWLELLSSEPSTGAPASVCWMCMHTPTLSCCSVVCMLTVVVWAATAAATVCIAVAGVCTLLCPCYCFVS